jgi:hypothetical protein
MSAIVLLSKLLFEKFGCSFLNIKKNSKEYNTKTQLKKIIVA